MLTLNVETNFNEIHIWKKLMILNLLVVSGIGELGWTQTRVG